MASSLTISLLLKEANLQIYAEKFLQFGADAPKQIALMSQSHFLQLVQHVGMSNKPFHVTRLLAALHNAFGITPDYEMPPIPEKSKLVYHGQPEFLSAVNTEVFETVPKRRKAKPYYGEVKLPSDEIFAELTDVRTVEETNELVTQLAAVYKGDKLNKYQQYINACAAELAIRDPTLLARRGDLVAKARETNIRGGKYKFHKGFSISKTAPEEINAQSNSKSNFALANKHREARLSEIQNVENTINKCMFEKEGLFERLKNETDKDNTAAIGSVRSRLDSLEEQLYVSKKRLSKLKNSQKRSEKYYTVKLSKLISDDEKPKDGSPNSSLRDSPKGAIKITNCKKSSCLNEGSSESGYLSMSLDDLDVESLGTVTVSTTNHRSTYEFPTAQNPASQSRDFPMSNENTASCVIEQDILTDVFTNTINSNLTNPDVDTGFDLPNYHNTMNST